jgi:hypothetical protein
MGLAERLQERRAEIEQATLARVHAVSDPGEVDDPEYVLGLKKAVCAAIAYAIAAIDLQGSDPSPVPEHLLTQARAAARNGVPLDTVLRRYSAGYALLGDFLIREAEEGAPVQNAELKRALRAEAAIFDHLVTSISRAYAHEAEGRSQGSSWRRAQWVRKLLAGEPVDLGELGYVLDAWHLAVIASGPGSQQGLRHLCAVLERNLLLIRGEGEAAWAWLGGRSSLSPREVLSLAERSLPPETLLAVGEPGKGIRGWRLSHRQAMAAMAVAQRGPERRVCYVGVALLASALRDDVLARSLQDLYLTPLEDERDGGAALRRTLHAYLAVGQNASSAASALGISRKTVSTHLRVVGEKIGRPVNGCAPELEIALRLRSLSNRAEDGS